MMQEQKILSAIVKSRNVWQETREHIDPREFGADTVKILGYIDEYYTADPNCRSCDPELLVGKVRRETPNEKHANLLIGVLTNLPDVSGVNVAREILSAKAHYVGQRLASGLARGDDNSTIRRLITEYVGLQSSDQLGPSDDDEVVESWGLGSLVGESFKRENLIKLWPSALSERLDGGARPGHHILVFAPTEMGKTLVVINMVAGFTAQGLRTLYVGNEDPVADLQMRFITRLVGRAKADVIKYPQRCQELVDEKNYKNVIWAPLAPGTFSKIRALVEKFKPDVVVLDQLRNLDVDSENRTQALERAATDARNLAKSANVLVISVTQAGDSASGKRSLNRGDVDGSNVGIPGQVDVMIGIGATEEDEKNGIRFLSFPKNKLSGNHDPLQIQVDPVTSRVLDQVPEEWKGKATNDDEFRRSEVTRAHRAA